MASRQPSKPPWDCKASSKQSKVVALVVGEDGPRQVSTAWSEAKQEAREAAVVWLVLLGRAVGCERRRDGE